MSLYGAARETTPNLNRLAKRSVVFDNAFTTASWTLPAHTSMMTGRYPLSISADPTSTSIYHGASRTLPEILRENGYATAAFTSGFFVSEAHGFRRGFDHYFELPFSVKEGRTAPQNIPKGPSAERLLGWVGDWGDTDKPFFVFFHTFECHTYYLDRRYVEEGKGGRAKDIFQVHPDPVFAPFCWSGLDASDEEKNHLLALYDGGVAAADELIGAIVSGLEGLGLMDETVLIITSDHGEEFWGNTNRSAAHGHTLYDDVVRIPFLWYEPGVRQAGKRIETPISLVDIFPTVLKRYDVEPLPENVDGTVLSPLLDASGAMAKRPLFIDGNNLGPLRYAVRDEDLKLIWTPDPNTQQHPMDEEYPVPVRSTVELYAVEDRNEARNLAAAKKGEAERLLGLIEARRQLASRIEARPSVEIQLDEEARERMRGLGYLK